MNQPGRSSERVVRDAQPDPAAGRDEDDVQVERVRQRAGVGDGPLIRRAQSDGLVVALGSKVRQKALWRCAVAGAVEGVSAGKVASNGGDIEAAPAMTMAVRVTGPPAALPPPRQSAAGEGVEGGADALPGLVRDGA